MQDTNYERRRYIAAICSRLESSILHPCPCYVHFIYIRQNKETKFSIIPDQKGKYFPVLQCVKTSPTKHLLYTTSALSKHATTHLA